MADVFITVRLPETPVPSKMKVLDVPNHQPFTAVVSGYRGLFIRHVGCLVFLGPGVPTSWTGVGTEAGLVSEYQPVALDITAKNL